MPTDQGNCGSGYVYNDHHTPDLPRMKDEHIHDVAERKETQYGFDWPGIGPPSRLFADMPPSVRRRREHWDE